MSDIYNADSIYTQLSEIFNSSNTKDNDKKLAKKLMNRYVRAAINDTKTEGTFVHMQALELIDRIEKDRWKKLVELANRVIDW